MKRDRTYNANTRRRQGLLKIIKEQLQRDNVAFYQEHEGRVSAHAARVQYLLYGTKP